MANGKFVTLFLLCYSLQAINSHEIDKLYHALNVTCFAEEKQLCRSEATTCASASLIESTGDECAVLYQFLTPGLACNLNSHDLRDCTLKWWSDGVLVSPGQLSHFVVGLKLSLQKYFSVNFVSDKCFSTADILQDQGLSAQKCFSSTSVGQLCSAIVYRLSKGESICDAEVVDEVSCLDNTVEQLFHTLADEGGKLSLTQLQLLIDQLPGEDHKVVRREEDHHDDDHDHDHDHDDDAQQNCPTEAKLMEEFNHVLEEMDADGFACYMDQHLNDSDHDHDDDDDDHDDDHDHDNATNCSMIYQVCRDLILDTGLTTAACLNGTAETKSSDKGHHEDHDDSPSSSQAYGYGFLTSFIISAASQLGLITVIFSVKSPWSKYVMSFLIATGVSTLVSDAILHLIPHGFGLHEHEEGGHDHGGEEGQDEEDHGHDKTIIWRGVVLLAGILIFYIFEFVMGMIKKNVGNQEQTNSNGTSIGLKNVGAEAKEIDDTSSQTESTKDCLPNPNDHPPYYNPNQGLIRGVPAVAWIIIFGDGLHNFADGIAIGASFTSSIGLGFSVSLAILFHEIPHEFGDFAILLSSGMRWYVALMYNFLSAVSAIIGMFIGVAIGTAQEDATAWILAITAGVFLYVSLVDLMPLLLKVLDNCEDNRSTIIYLTCQMLGFMVGFIILLFIALYEEDINQIFE